VRQYIQNTHIGFYAQAILFLPKPCSSWPCTQPRRLHSNHYAEKPNLTFEQLWCSSISIITTQCVRHLIRCLDYYGAVVLVSGSKQAPSHQIMQSNLDDHGNTYSPAGLFVLLVISCYLLCVVRRLYPRVETKTLLWFKCMQTSEHSSTVLLWIVRDQKCTLYREILNITGMCYIVAMLVNKQKYLDVCTGWTSQGINSKLPGWISPGTAFKVCYMDRRDSTGTRPESNWRVQRSPIIPCKSVHWVLPMPCEVILSGHVTIEGSFSFDPRAYMTSSKLTYSTV